MQSSAVVVAWSHRPEEQGPRTHLCVLMVAQGVDVVESVDFSLMVV